MRRKNPDRLKIIVIAVLTVVITILHFGLRQNYHYGHIVLRELYFLPILLGAFWFGIKGGLVTSIGISILYSPLIFMHWQNFAPDDLDKMLEVVLFNVVALVLGILRDREKRREKEKREAILALTGTVAHELNTPLQVALGNSQLLQDDFEPESDAYKDLQNIIKNLKNIRQIVKKISFKDRFSLKSYVGETKIVDIESDRTGHERNIHV